MEKNISTRKLIANNNRNMYQGFVPFLRSRASNFGLLREVCVLSRLLYTTLKKPAH